MVDFEFKTIDPNVWAGELSRQIQRRIQNADREELALWFKEYAEELIQQIKISGNFPDMECFSVKPSLDNQQLDAVQADLTKQTLYQSFNLRNTKEIIGNLEIEIKDDKK